MASTADGGPGCSISRGHELGVLAQAGWVAKVKSSAMRVGRMVTATVASRSSGTMAVRVATGRLTSRVEQARCCSLIAAVLAWS